MTALAVNLAPSAALPMRYLSMVPVWGLVAAIMILHEGQTLFVSRWALNTIALTHAFTLGVLGNAMLGSLLQFLPVAAGVRLRPPSRLGLSLPFVFNLGLLGLVFGLLQWPALIPWAGLTLTLSFAIPLLDALRAIRFDGHQTGLRISLSLVMLCLLVTVLLGFTLTLGLSGHITIPMLPLTDNHAAIGLLGGVILLCGSVGSVILPMLQGTAALPKYPLHIWLITLVGLLALGVGLRLTNIIDGDELSKLLMLPVAAFAMTVLFLQWRAPHRRNRTLVGFWCLASLCLLAAVGVVLVAPIAHRTVLAGVLGIGIALPALIIGMLLEIAPFIAWLKLLRQRSKGRRTCSVDELLPEARKQRLLAFYALAALAVPVAAYWPNTSSTRVAGLLLAIAHGLVLFELFALSQRTRRFVGVASEPNGVPV